MNLSLPGSSLRTLTAIMIGSVVGIGLASARDSSPKHYAPAIAGLIFLLVAAVWKYGEELCLFSLLVTVPLPMHAFLLKLEPLHGGGALGLYLLASDAPLAILLIYWFFDWSRATRPCSRSGKQALLLLPFLAVGLMSVFYAEKPLWAFCEWLRWVKVLAILLYVMYRLRAKDFDLVLLGLSVSVMLEGLIAALQAAFRSNLGLEKLGFGSTVSEEVSTGRLFRGSALSGHPNYLATYLILLMPVIGLLALAEPRRRYRWWWSTAFLVGLAGLGATMSRAAIASFLGASVLGMILGVAYRLTSVGRVALIAAVGVLTLGSVGLYFQEAITERIRKDWDASWELRTHLNNSAISMAEDNIALGVGLNNYTIAYPSYNPEFAAKLIDMDDMLTAVHNLYLLVWAELGTVGLVTFLIFLFGAVITAWRSARKLDRMGRCVMLGFVCGLLAAIANDMTEFTLWIDLNMFTVAFVFGLLPALRERAQSSLWACGS